MTLGTRRARTIARTIRSGAVAAAAVAIETLAATAEIAERIDAIDAKLAGILAQLDALRVAVPDPRQARRSNQ